MKSISRTATQTILSRSMEVNLPGRSLLAVGNSIGAGAYGLTTPGGTTWCQLPPTVNVGDICHPSYYDLRLSFVPQMRCVRSGDIGVDEPVWPTVGKTVNDGTAIWIVEDMGGNANQNPGALRIGLALSGHPFDVDYTIACPGRPCDYVLDILDRVLGVYNPDIIYFSDLFANSITQMNGATVLILREWNRLKKILESSISIGRVVMLQSVAPSVFYNAPNLVRAASIVDGYFAEFAKNYPSHVIFTSDYSGVVSSPVFGENYLPDNTTTYITYNNPFDKITDGVHPQNVAQYRFGKMLGLSLANLNRPVYQFLDRGETQKWINPKNLGNGGTLYAPLTGIAPTGWQAGRDGVAIADCQFVDRDNGSRWWMLDCSSAADGKIWANCAYSLASLDLTFGDEIDCFIEFVGEDFSDTVHAPRVEIAFYNAIKYPNFASLLYTSGQPFGQAMKSDNLEMVARPIPFNFKIPAGTTNIAVTVEIQGTGAWSGKFKLGRINLVKK